MACCRRDPTRLGPIWALIRGWCDEPGRRGRHQGPGLGAPLRRGRGAGCAGRPCADFRDARLRGQWEQENPASNAREMIDDFHLWGSLKCRRRGVPLSDEGGDIEG